MYSVYRSKYLSVKSKKSQFAIIGITFMILAIISINYIMINNSYKDPYRGNYLLNNIMIETCKVGKNSNGSFIESRYDNYSTNIINYCQNKGYQCLLNITKQGSAPANLSLLNYTHFDYKINYNCLDISYNSSFNC